VFSCDAVSEPLGLSCYVNPNSKEMLFTNCAQQDMYMPDEVTTRLGSFRREAYESIERSAELSSPPDPMTGAHCGIDGTVSHSAPDRYSLRLWSNYLRDH
jgi:hypothetical protein